MHAPQTILQRGQVHGLRLRIFRWDMRTSMAAAASWVIIPRTRLSDPSKTEIITKKKKYMHGTGEKPGAQ